MDRSQYEKIADRCLQRVTDWLEDFDPDELDFEEADGVVSMTFADGSKFVINRQAGSHQMWLAAGARAWHYDWDPANERWIDDRDGHGLYENLGRVISEKLGRDVAVND